MTKKHILLITADGRPGGGVTNVLQLCRGLAASSDWRVSLCSQSGSYAIEQARLICDSVHEVDFFTSRFDPRVTWNVKRLIREMKPDLVHTHGGRAALPATYALENTSIPLVHTVHGFHFYQKSALMRIGAIRAEKRIARHADWIIFVCGNDQEIARRERIVNATQQQSVILHGIDLAQLPPHTTSNQPTVALLGRLTYQKRPEMLIEIADRMRMDNVRFVYIGGGELQPELEAEVSRRNLNGIVSFTGPLPREAALARVARAEVAILPSRWEGFPIAVLEVMGMGIPMVASRVNGISEIIDDGENGFLVDGANPLDYVERISCLLNDETLRSEFGRRAHQTVQQRFTEARMVDEHMALYAEAALGSPVSRIPMLPTAG